MRRTMLIWAAGVPLLAGCSPAVDVDRIEIDIGADIAEQIGIPSGQMDVECPSGLDWSTGDDFHCLAEDPDGTRYRITVTMESDDGDYTWVVG